MPAGRGSHLAVAKKALLHDPKLGSITPVPPASGIRGRQDFDLGSELTVGHKVGRITGIEIPSDGFRRRDTVILPWLHLETRSIASDFRIGDALLLRQRTLCQRSNAERRRAPHQRHSASNPNIFHCCLHRFFLPEQPTNTSSH